MPLTKERKVLLGLLGSAGIILAIDQVLLSPPSGAKAAPSRTETPALRVEAGAIGTLPSQKSDVLSPTVTGEAMSLWNAQARQRASAEPDTVVADPFITPVDQLSNATRVAAQQFLQQNRLTAVLAAGEQGVAMVNGKPVRLGGEISGYRLVRIDSRSAEFVAGDVVVRLSLPGESTGGP